MSDIGYKDNYCVIEKLSKQSNDIARGTNDVIGGAGDNGMMFGYAVDETEQILPKSQVILQEFAKEYDKVRKALKHGK